MNAIAIINQFAKCAEPNPLQRYRARFHKLTPEAQRRAIENILAGDPADVAIKDAKRFVEILEDKENEK